MSSLAYISLSMPDFPGFQKNQRQLTRRALDYALEEIPAEQLAESIRACYRMGGVDQKKGSSVFDAEIVLTDDYMAGSARRALFRNMEGIWDDMGGFSNAVWEGDRVTWRVEYDPAKWYSVEEDQEANRLFWLASAGVLQKLGFEIEGTGL